jgi:hypothetical protein
MSGGCSALVIHWRFGKVKVDAIVNHAGRNSSKGVRISDTLRAGNHNWQTSKRTVMQSGSDSTLQLTHQ